MLFKNLTFMKMADEGLFISEDDLEARRFTPCGKNTLSSTGWVPPMGDDFPFIHEVMGNQLICLRTEEKIIPPDVLKQATLEKVCEIEEKEDRKLKAAERAEVKENVLFEMLPKAFSKISHTYGYLSSNKWLIVGVPSYKKAESFASKLREAVGSLPVSIPVTNESPQIKLSNWLVEGSGSSGFFVRDTATFVDTCEGGGKVSLNKKDLFSGEAVAHINMGMRVSSIALAYEDRVSFTLTADLNIKSVKLLDIVLEERESVDVDTDEDRFDTDFSLLTAELNALIPAVVNAFGGLSGGKEGE